MSKQTTTGAASALAWISQKEAEGRADVERLEKELQQAIRNQSANPAEMDGADFDKLVKVARANLDDAMDRQFKLLRQLRDFDKSVEPAKRDASESITKSEGQKIFRMFSIYTRTAFERIKCNIVPRVRESKTDEDGYLIVESEMRDCLLNALSGAAREEHLPQWIVSTIEETL